MNIENLSLVFFTVLMQCAIGLSFAGACYGKRANLSEKEECILSALWRIIAIFAALGLIVSLTHLAKPIAAPMALKNLGISWLSAEALSAGAFFGLSVLMALFLSKAGNDGMRFLAFLTALVGLATIFLQGLTYAPEAMPAIANGFPFALFLATAVILGAGLGRILLKCECECKSYSTAIWIMLSLLLVVPCVWASGSEIMRATAFAWIGSTFYIASIVLFVLALIFEKLDNDLASFITVAAAVICSRIVFFDSTLHTNTLLGLPY